MIVSVNEKKLLFKYILYFSDFLYNRYTYYKEIQIEMVYPSITPLSSNLATPDALLDQSNGLSPPILSS